MRFLCLNTFELLLSQEILENFVSSYRASYRSILHSSHTIISRIFKVHHLGYGKRRVPLGKYCSRYFSNILLAVTRCRMRKYNLCVFSMIAIYFARTISYDFNQSRFIKEKDFIKMLKYRSNNLSRKEKLN